MFYAGKCRCSGCFSYFIQSLSRIVLKNVIFCGISNTESGGVHVPGGGKAAVPGAVKTMLPNRIKRYNIKIQ